MERDCLTPSSLYKAEERQREWLPPGERSGGTALSRHCAPAGSYHGTVLVSNTLVVIQLTLVTIHQRETRETQREIISR